MSYDDRSRPEEAGPVVVIQMESALRPTGPEPARETALGAALLAVAIVAAVALIGGSTDRPDGPEPAEQPPPADRTELSWDDLPGLLDGELQWDDLPAVLRGASQP